MDNKWAFVLTGEMVEQMREDFRKGLDTGEIAHGHGAPLKLVHYLVDDLAEID